MSGISNYLEEKLINLVLRNTAYTSPGTSLYVSLHSADPAETGANELSGGSYARVQVSAWDAPAGRAIVNTNAIEFPELTATISTATHMGIWDASSGGNFLWQTPSTEGFVFPMQVGAVPTFSAGSVSISLTGNISTYLSHALLNHVFRNTSFSTPGANIYLSLHSAAPGLTGANEISGNDYARKQAEDWDAPNNGETSNTDALTFETPSADWGTITHVGLWSALTGGNPLSFVELVESVNVTSGNAPSIGAGDITLAVA